VIDAMLILFCVCWALIGFTYLGFPVLLAWFARRTSSRETQPLSQNGELPRVLMVVAAHNEEAVIREKLANSWALNYPADRFRLCIGSDGSDDRTNDFLQECPDPRLKTFLFAERRGKISVLNDLMRHADADIVVFSDANTLFEPDALRLLTAPFADPKVGCVSGELVIADGGGASGEGLYWKYEGWIKRNEARLGFLMGCNGGIFAIRPELYEALPASTIVEDFVLTLRILERGHEVRFVPEARGTEPPCESTHAEMKRKIRIGAGGFQALGLNRALLNPRFGMISFAFWGHKVLRWLVPQFFLAAFAVNIFLARTLPVFAVLLVMQILGAMVAAWVYAAAPGVSRPKWAKPIGYFYLMNYALGCGFLRFLFGTQRVTWERATFSQSALLSERSDTPQVDAA
jgi:poly-beta-1,6-N-acetyl-D-glucosamine synthase